MEGIGCILAGMWGTGSGTTSYAGTKCTSQLCQKFDSLILFALENIAALGITKVARRKLSVTITECLRNCPVLYQDDCLGRIPPCDCLCVRGHACHWDFIEVRCADGYNAGSYRRWTVLRNIRHDQRR